MLFPAPDAPTMAAADAVHAAPEPPAPPEHDEGYAGVALDLIEAFGSGVPTHTAVNVPNDLAAHWMPFTANRAFKKAPRLLAGAKDMHYFTVDGRKIFVFSQDFTIFGGALGEVYAEKIHKVMDLAESVAYLRHHVELAGPYSTL